MSAFYVTLVLWVVTGYFGGLFAIRLLHMAGWRREPWLADHLAALGASFLAPVWLWLMVLYIAKPERTIALIRRHVR